MEYKKPLMQYSAKELERIYQQMHPGALLAPIKQQESPIPGVGPKFLVFRLYSEIDLGPIKPEVAYWDALQKADVIDGIGEFSWVNANLSETRATDQQVHQAMMTRFIEPDLLRRITNRELQGAATSVVFNRIGCLLAMRHLMLFGGTSPQGWNSYKVGRLALLANDFIQKTPNPTAAPPSNLELLLLFAPTWDVYNVRNLGNAMSRTFTILTKILPGSDPTVKTLVSQVGISANNIEINSIPLHQFSSLVFGLFAFARSPEAQARVLFNVNEIFAQTDLPQALLKTFLDVRARTLNEFRMLLSKGKAISRSTFSEELKQRSFLTNSLNVFRKHPFLRLDDEQILMLDVQFVAELLTFGVYWSIYDALPKERRGAFKQLWGRMFELYIVNLLADFYPPMSRMLSADIEYSNGQIDALIDFGGYVLVFEIKSSLLTEPAKRNANKESFLTDFRRKFVENERGKPKAIKQLATACCAILAGEIETAKVRESPVIYPIFVSDEPTVEATFMNAFFHQEFQREGITNTKVKPLTVMSVDELEQTLSYVTDNDFSWEELLESRFNEFGVYPNSVGQAIYALVVMKGLISKQNPALKGKHDEFGKIMRAIYKRP